MEGLKNSKIDMGLHYLVLDFSNFFFVKERAEKTKPENTKKVNHIRRYR
jgi:hypothetical protein